MAVEGFGFASDGVTNNTVLLALSIRRAEQTILQNLHTPIQLVIHNQKILFLTVADKWVKVLNLGSKVMIYTPKACY